MGGRGAWHRRAWTPPPTGRPLASAPWLVLCFVCTLLSDSVTAPTTHAQAAAQQPELQLRWTASGCGSAESVLARVEQLLGRPLAQRSGRSFVVSGSVQPGPAGQQLTLRSTSRAGVWTRKLTADDCEQLTEAAALVLALAVAPGRASELMAAAAEPPPVTDDASQPTTTRDLSFELGAGIGLSWGDLPSARPGVAASAGLGVERWRLAVAGAWWLPSSAEQPPFSSELSLWTLGLDVCRDVLSGEHLRMAACLGAEAGRARAVPAGDLIERATGSHAWLAALAHLRGVVELLPRLSLGLHVGMDAPLTRRRFVVESADGETVVLHRPSPVGLRALVGVVVPLTSR